VISAPPPRLLDTVREHIRLRHYSVRTERTYVHWIRRFIFFHGKRHPRELGGDHVTAFLSALANHDRVSAATQNQALAALLFLYREVLGVELPWLANIVRAKRSLAVVKLYPGQEHGFRGDALDDSARLAVEFLTQHLTGPDGR